MIAQRQEIEQKDPFIEISRRLANMETHIINMIIPMQNLSKYADPNFLTGLKEVTASPLLIDDTGLKCVLNDFKELMSKFHKGTWAIDPDKVYDKLKGLDELMTTIFIQNDRILKKLDDLEKENVKKKVFITVSGYNCENKPIEQFTKMQEDFLNSDIWDENTTMRLANFLHEHNLKTWRQVLQYGKINFYKTQRFGKKAILEIEEVFKRHDIVFT